MRFDYILRLITGIFLTTVGIVAILNCNTQPMGIFIMLLIGFLYLFTGILVMLLPPDK